jgi:MFS family permease
VSSQVYGLLIALNGVMIIVLQPMTLAWVQRFDRYRVLMAGAVLTGLGFWMTGLAHAATGYAVSIAVWTVGEIIMAPIGPAIVADMAPTALRGASVPVPSGRHAFSPGSWRPSAMAVWPGP